MNLSLYTLLALGLICGVVNAANPPPITTCIKDMSRVFNNELKVTDTSVKRTYILCPNTVFSPGIANPDTGEISGGQKPLACRSNCLIKCGNSGASSNKCVIDGTGTFGIFQVAYNVFPNQPKVIENVVYQGITIDFFVSADQTPVLAASFFGDVTFLDCIWSNNSADPAFVLSELKAATTARSAVIDAPPETPRKLPGFVWKVSANDAVLGRNLVEKDVETVDSPIVQDNMLQTRRQLRASDIPRRESTEVRTEGDRILQTTGNFEVFFRRCFFDVRLLATTCHVVAPYSLTPLFSQFNDPVRNAKSQGGLSLMRFNGALVKESDGTVTERLGGMHGTIINSKFRDNVYNFNNDVAVRISWCSTLLNVTIQCNLT